MLYIDTLFHFNRLHTTAKAVSEAEYPAYGAAKPGPQVAQVHCIIITQLNVHVQPPLACKRPPTQNNKIFPLKAFQLKTPRNDHLL